MCPEMQCYCFPLKMIALLWTLGLNEQFGMIKMECLFDVTVVQKKRNIPLLDLDCKLLQ